MRLPGTLLLAALLLSSGGGALAHQATTAMPKYPLKTARQLFSDAQIAQARANVARYPSARRVADALVKAADEWLNRTDEEISALVTPATVPRAFDVGASVGCPRCGKTIHEKFGAYPWIVDLKKPFKLVCPVDNSVYPTNDYAAFVKSGFKKQPGADTAYVDNGWGWKNPQNGETYWFVAHYNHRVWHEHLGPGVRTLGRAYLLTGDKRYAHKTALLLSRIADVYPAMDHETQSRYGTMQAARGRRYPGKVLNHIWETSLAAGLADAYDAVWETIDGDADLARATGRPGPATRAHIEANLLENALEAYFAGKIRGNFGMHQDALARLALARQFGPTQKWFDELLRRNDPSPAYLGLEWALYNLVFRDGVPSESAPGYNFLWVSKIAGLTSLLRSGGHDLFALPKMRSLFDGVINVVNIGQHTPSLGDSGSVYGGLVGQNADVFQTAFRAYNDPRYAQFLAGGATSGDKGFQSFDALFHPPIKVPPGRLPPQAARLLDGYGLGILSNPSDTVSASLYYGLRAGHGHFDRLTLEVFAAGQPLLPDLGYPDAMNDYVPGIYTWSKNTIAHNTVTVDAQKQPNNAPGVVRLFAAGPFARVIDVDAPGTYPQCSLYRRALIQIDASANDSYYVDVFTVAGGTQHDYSLHGPPGAFQAVGGAFSPPAPGTLAGADVALGQIYDDPVLGAQDYQGGYNAYAGSGFQHLFNVQRQQNTDNNKWLAEWRPEKNKNARLRVRVLPQPGQEILLANARVSPVKNPQVLSYVLARRRGEHLASRFVSVIEPLSAAQPFVADVRPFALDSGEGVALAVRRAKNNETDLVLYDAQGSAKTLEGYRLTTDARAVVITLDAAGRNVRRVFFAGGTFLRVAGRTFTAPPALAGTVVSVDPARRTIGVRLDAAAPGQPDTAALAGRVAHFVSDLRQTAHPLVSVRRQNSDTLILSTADDLLIGRARLSKVDAATLGTNTPLPLAPLYQGAAVSPDFSHFARVRAVEGGTIRLVSPQQTPHSFHAGQDVWLVNVGPGDRLEIPALYSWSTQEETN